jgi:aminoglycoside 6'-N-acetyltransferase
MAHDFRSLTPRDLKLVERWLEEPHVRRWWGDPREQLAEIREALESESTEPMIAEHAGRAFAYVQAYDPHMEDRHPYQDQPTGTLGIDFFIGEPAMLRQGHGTGLLADLAAMLFEEGAPRLVADPDPGNAVAIRTYRKAGFTEAGLRNTPFGTVMMMVLENDQLEEGE